MKIKCKVNPSLALIKYWGKRDKFLNIPATSSIAVSVDKFYSISELELSCKDEIILNSRSVILKEREINFFNYARKILNKSDVGFRVISENNFPTAAGLASSSSGFASIAACILKYFNQYSHQKASDLARIGSASASRAIYGGFTLLKEGSKSAFQLSSINCFNDLCIIFAIVDGKEKEISSRIAMEICTQEKFYWDAWIGSSRRLFKEALYFFLKGDFNEFGLKIVKSYQRMFALMLSSSIIYFKGNTIELIKYIADLRNKGIPVFETMDAGPQVKVLCLEKNLELILDKLTNNFKDIDFIVSRIGSGLEWI
ncbi:diphosphomevalonate decarboxylase [Borrelia anserina]|uniref:diphosphomevalonate decarboxylase n=2 Tax=Borrelia anserina TaxID=143 RepID=W5SP18_BORAN|nr:diphosphomevalonate decarboxylase [Borrelia anserina]AHH08655.1 Diphosphomevalonate decarboxylase [Borrelia anserina BA2]APR65112.1 diphosphomevalonate decarboxylase [Borrelia anserina Es]UPA07038.1 diphosphomevalonate decarboxylase [Borrelia anserina]